MKKVCPLMVASHLVECGERCVLYEDDGCLIKQALKCYINEHTPMKTYDPYKKTEKELYDMLMSVKPNVSFIDKSLIDDIPF